MAVLSILFLLQGARLLTRQDTLTINDIFQTPAVVGSNKAGRVSVGDEEMRNILQRQMQQSSKEDKSGCISPYQYDSCAYSAA